MMIPESEAVTKMKTSIGQALAIVVIKIWVRELSFLSLWTKRMTRGAFNKVMNARSLENEKKSRWFKQQASNTRNEVLTVLINITFNPWQQNVSFATV